MWLFQGVLNAGLQVLLSILGGWLCARLHLVEPEVLSRSLNVFAMRAAFSCFIVHLLGIKTDLRDTEAWRALGVFVLWVMVIQLACLIWFKLSRGTVQQLGMNCLLLTTNNTGVIGWPVLTATVGKQGAALSMLLGVLFFIQLLPVPIACFEYAKWLATHSDDTALPEVAPIPPDVAAAPGSSSPKPQPLQQLVSAASAPPGFRYCYWSTADYSSQPATPATAAPAQPCPNCLEVVCSTTAFGGRDEPPASNTSSAGQQPATAAAPAASGTTSQQQGQPDTRRLQLKRAKDSCDSLQSDGAAAAADSKLQQPLVLQSPKPPGPSLATLTRRLSRGLSIKTAAGAAALPGGEAGASAAGATPKPASAQAAERASGRLPSKAGTTAAAAAQGGQPAAVQGTTSGGGGGGGGGISNDNEAGPRRPAGMIASPFAAVDSAVELHRMMACDSNGSSSTAKGECDVPCGGERGGTIHVARFAAGSSSSSSFTLGSRPGSRVDSRTCLLLPLAAPHDRAPGAGSKAGPGRLSVAAPAPPAEQPAGGYSRPRWLGGFAAAHPLLCHITAVQLQSVHLWLNLLAIALSVSGLRRFLDPESPSALLALGWVDGVLAWFSAACIPVLLFSNGVWMQGKNIVGGRQGQAQVMLLLLLKLTLLPALMAGLAKLFGLSGPYGLSLVLLSSCPLAPLAFLVCQQFGVGAELATSVTIQGLLLMLPQMMAVIKICQVAGVFPGVSLLGS